MSESDRPDPYAPRPTLHEVVTGGPPSRTSARVGAVVVLAVFGVIAVGAGVVAFLAFAS